MFKAGVSLENLNYFICLVLTLIFTVVTQCVTYNLYTNTRKYMAQAVFLSQINNSMSLSSIKRKYRKYKRENILNFRKIYHMMIVNMRSKMQKTHQTYRIQSQISIALSLILYSQHGTLRQPNHWPRLFPTAGVSRVLTLIIISLSPRPL